MMQLAGGDGNSLAAGQDEWPRHMLRLRDQVEEVLAVNPLRGETV
jgi:hypothetical protein